MKKTLLLFAIIYCNVIFAQQTETNEKLIIEKKTWELGGSIRFGEGTGGALESQFAGGINRTSSFVVTATGGYAVLNNVIAGLNLGYFSIGVEDRNSNYYSVGTYVKLFKGVGKKTALNLQTNFNYLFGKPREIDFRTNLPGNETSDYRSFTIAISPGLTYFISKKIAFNASIGSLSYLSYKQENPDTSDFEGSDLRLSLSLSQVNLGLNIYL